MGREQRGVTSIEAVDDVSRVYTTQNIVGHVKFSFYPKSNRKPWKFFVCFFLAMPPSLQDLSFPTGDQTQVIAGAPLGHQGNPWKIFKQLVDRGGKKERAMITFAFWKAHTLQCEEVPSVEGGTKGEQGVTGCIREYRPIRRSLEQSIEEVMVAWSKVVKAEKRDYQYF